MQILNPILLFMGCNAEEVFPWFMSFLNFFGQFSFRMIYLEEVNVWVMNFLGVKGHFFFYESLLNYTAVCLISILRRLYKCWIAFIENFFIEKTKYLFYSRKEASYKRLSQSVTIVIHHLRLCVSSFTLGTKLTIITL